ncbi:MAG: glutamine synthetase III, partial [Psychroserpens sp.]|nr:glutamine synthetase III [Psychroserpens sp.]
MSTLRFHALKEAFNHKPLPINESDRRSELFGQNVFNEDTMRQYLTKEAFVSVSDAITHGSKIDRTIADHIASG